MYDAFRFTRVFIIPPKLIGPKFKYLMDVMNFIALGTYYRIYRQPLARHPNIWLFENASLPDVVQFRENI